MALPWEVRLKTRRQGRVFVFDVAGAPEAAAVHFQGATEDAAVRATLRDGLCAVFVPKGARAILLPPDAAAVRLGYFPRTKLGLKLHAFLNGTFEARSVLKRWHVAGMAARDLRGAQGALLQGSEAHLLEQAEDYRRYRTRYVADFSEPVPPAGDLLVSFLTVPGPADAAALRAALAALQGQSDPQWEWLVALPPGLDFAAPDEPRVRCLRMADDLPATGLNAALAAAAGPLAALLDPRGRLMRDAVAMVRTAFAAHGDCALLYTDEERLDDDGRPFEGVFKPAFNRHLLRSLDYLGDLTVARTALLREVGGARPSLGDATRYDLLLRAAESLLPQAIRHLPRVAFSRPGNMGNGTFSPATAPLAARALGDLLGVPVSVRDGRLRPDYALPEPAPLVSFVIPTRDRADLMGLALRSLIAKTRYRHFEIVILDNGSVEPETFALFEEIKAAWPATVVVRDDGGFNYPRICNRGVEAASGSLICLLNNDIEVVDGDWLGEMVALASLPRTGIVGAKLLFPDRTIQHAGVIAGLFAYAGHWFAHAEADAPGYQGRLHSRQNLSAVTGACLMISRACWDAIGPLDAERFAEDCNDIDLCLRARAADYELVWTPFAWLVHHESASRGRRRSKAHRERLKAQRARFEDLWHASTLVDPHYNPNLRRKSLYATLAAAPEGSRAARTDALARTEPAQRS